MARQEPHRVGVHNRRRGALIHQRHRYTEGVVHRTKLGQVGQLVRSGHVADRRKQRVLDDRPQQHVGTEFSRLRLHAVAARRRRVGDEDRRPRAIQVKDGRVILLRCHLHVITTRRQLRPRRGCQSRCGASLGRSRGRGPAPPVAWPRGQTSRTRSTRADRESIPAIDQRRPPCRNLVRYVPRRPSIKPGRELGRRHDRRQLLDRARHRLVEPHARHWFLDRLPEVCRLSRR